MLWQIQLVIESHSAAVFQIHENPDEITGGAYSISFPSLYMDVHSRCISTAKTPSWCQCRLHIAGEMARFTRVGSWMASMVVCLHPSRSDIPGRWTVHTAATLCPLDSLSVCMVEIEVSLTSSHAYLMYTRVHTYMRRQKNTPLLYEQRIKECPWNTA